MEKDVEYLDFYIFLTSDIGERTTRFSGPSLEGAGGAANPERINPD